MGETDHHSSHNFWCCDQDLDTQSEKVTVEKRQSDQDLDTQREKVAVEKRQSDQDLDTQHEKVAVEKRQSDQDLDTQHEKVAVGKRQKNKGECTLIKIRATRYFKIWKALNVYILM